MRILSVQKGADTAGQAIRMQQAFAKYAPSWSFRAMTQPGASDYISYPFDLKWSNKTVKEMWPDIDVIHVHNNFNTLHWMERRWPTMARKPTVVHHHGTQFRQNQAELTAEQVERRAIGIVSTLDLYLLAPDTLEWLPAPYNVDWLESLRGVTDPRVVRIAHAPTNREIKSTDAFLAATQQLKAEGYPIEVDLIERATWKECLERKSRADIFFDQVILGFGCNSLEAWGMGIPVVSGCDPVKAAKIGHVIPDVTPEYQRRFGELPYYEATEATIYDALKALVESPELRKQYGERGRQHVRRYHHESVVVEQLQSIYRRALEAYGCTEPASTAAA